MAKIYVSTNASTGSGSLAEALSSASDGDVISFSENVFEHGALIEIALVQTLVVDKNLTFDGGPFRVRSTPISAFRCAEIATGKNVVFTGFDFVGGVASGNGGGILCNGTITLNRCKIAGCSASENGGGLSVESSGTANINDSLICGNKATNDNGGGIFIESSATATLNGVTIAANTGGSVSGNATSKNSLIADDLTLYGFVSPPSSVPTSENWTWTDWQNWDFHLLDDGSESPSPYRRSNIDADDLTTYDLDGNFRGLEIEATSNTTNETTMITRSAPGAYETIQADLFWIGKDSNGNDVSSPSWTSADGWAESRFATSSGARVPAINLTYFIGDNVDFDAPDLFVGSARYDDTTAIIIGGGRVVSFASFQTSSGTASVDFSLGVGAKIVCRTSNFYSSNSAKFGDFARVSASLIGGAPATSTNPSRRLALDYVGEQVVFNYLYTSLLVDDRIKYGFLMAYTNAAPKIVFDGRYDVGTLNIATHTKASGTIGVAEGTKIKVSSAMFGSASQATYPARLFSVPPTLILSSTATITDNAFLSIGASTFADAFIVELQPGAVATLILDGQKVCGVGTSATLTGNAKVDGDGLTLGSLTLNANAVLTFDAGYLGASSASLASGSALNGTGFYAFDSTTNDGGTFATTLAQVEYGAGITSFDALATAPTTATLTWTQTDATKTILIERQTANGWAAVDEAASNGTSTVELPAPGATNYRVWDGVNFLTDAAWSYFGVQFSVDVAFVDSTIFSSGTNWITEAKLIPTGSALIGQSKTILARIYDSFSNDASLLNNGLNIASTHYTIYKNSGNFFASGSTQTAVPGQTDVDAGSECVLETMQTSDAWNYSPGYNFVLPLNNSTTPCFAAAGSYLIKVTITLTTGNPIVFGIEINVS